MNKTDACRIIRPHYEQIVELIREANADFDSDVSDRVRPSVLESRAMFVSSRMRHLMTERFGRNANDPTYVRNLGGMETVIVADGKQPVALRFKKVDGHYQTSNHRSGQQDAVRLEGKFTTNNFPGLEDDVTQLFIGYRLSRGVEPALRDIALTFERSMEDGCYFVEWHEVIWNPRDEFRAPSTYTPPLVPGDSESTWTLEPRRADESGRASAGGG